MRGISFLVLHFAGMTRLPCVAWLTCITQREICAVDESRGGYYEVPSKNGRDGSTAQSGDKWTDHLTIVCVYLYLVVCAAVAGPQARRGLVLYHHLIYVGLADVHRIKRWR